MNVVDKRAIPLTVTFGDLPIGEAFQDDDGDICIKTDIGTYMYWTDYEWMPRYDLEANDLILPLSITYTIERKGEKLI